MLTVLESIKLSEEYLLKKGIESARINAELLLAGVLGCKRLDLYLKFDQPLSEKEKSVYREYIARRGKREPLQYILGEVEFFGLRLKVNDSVLIPRPETELLVEYILYNTDKENNSRVLDIGSGSGNISIALAKNLPDAKIFGIDVSLGAIEIANQNAILNDVTNNVNFVQADVLNELPTEIKIKYDLIVSNPPYVSSNEFETLQPEIKEYEPNIAVTDYDDGLKFYRRISEIASELLKENGKIYFELAEGQSEDVRKILEEYKFKNIIIKKDYSDIDRIISGELK